MKLRGQLLLATLLVLLLPVAGMQFIGQVEKLLRQGQEQALADSAVALARLLEPLPPAPESGALYVQRSAGPLFLDGYGDDWAPWLDRVERFTGDRRQNVTAESPGDPEWPLRLALADAPSGLHLLFRMHDWQTLFARGADRPGEQLELRFRGPAGHSRLHLAPAAPGRFTRQAVPDGPTVHGDWQVHAEGWNLELRIARRERPEALGFTLLDLDRHDGAPRVHELPGTVGLIAEQPALSAQLAELVPPGTSAWITTGQGDVLARARADRSALALPGREAGFWELLLFDRISGRIAQVVQPRRGEFTSRLRGRELDLAIQGTPGAEWVAALDSAEQGLRVRHALAIPDPAGALDQKPLLLVLERDADALMLLANEAVLRLTGLSLLAFMVVAGALLLFAWLLSQRIRRLQRVATRAVAADGRVLEVPPPARGSDELAELSRSVSRLLERLRGHQQYLRTLADKLAHELRTPLAMIDSSLDNLQARLDQPGTFDPEPARTLIDRAGEGSRRLNRILRAMSEAARLEDALIDEPLQRFDLAEMVADYCREFSAAHDQRYPAPLHFDRPPGPIMIEGSPDLIAQLLDKLLDNAIDFTPADGEIRVTVRDQRGAALLEVENTGPVIDAQAAATLFEPMVSLRPGRAGRSHLGLGLFIARLIAERHQGRLIAEPLPGGSRFRLELPVSAAPAE